MKPIISFYSFSCLLVFLLFFLNACNMKLEKPPLQYFYEGQQQHNWGHFDTALIYYTKAIEGDSFIPDFFYERGRVYYDLNEYGSAIKDFDHAIALFDGQVPNAKYYHALAKIYEEEEKYDVAIENARAALKIDAANPQLYSLIGNIHLAQGDTLGALDDYEQFLALAPGNPGFHNEIAIIYYQLGIYADAEESAKKAILLDEKNPEYYYSLALICSAMENDIHALDAINQAMEIDKTARKYYYLRAVVHLNLGNETEGCQDLRKAAEAGDEDAAELFDSYCAAVES